jgi:hypothetical protein
MRARRDPGGKPLARLRRRIRGGNPADVEAESARFCPESL